MALPRTVLRPLGTIEQYSSSRHSLGLYRNVITVCRYELPLSLLKDEDKVKTAIKTALATVVLERLPSLRVGIAEEDTKKPVYVSVPSLSLDEHVEWVPRTPGLAADEYDRLLADDMSRDNARAWPDIETHPPWRLVVYLNTVDGWADLAFALHHAVGDGKSGAMFHTEMVDVLNLDCFDSSQTKNGNVLTFTTLPELTPTQESLIDFKISWPFFFKTIWAELGPRWLKPAPKSLYYTGPRVAMHEHVLDGPLRLFHLTPQQAAVLLAGCREHGTTLTALMHGLQMVLFARRIPASVASSFACIMPISTRPAVLPSSMSPWALSSNSTTPLGPVTFDIDRKMGNFICGHKYVYSAEMVTDARSPGVSKDDIVWHAAAAVGADLKSRVATLRTDNAIGLMSWLSDFHKYWLQQDGKTRESTWGVSNTGAIADGTSSSAGSAEWRLRRNFYSQSSLGKDSLIGINVGSVRGGDLSFVVAWHRGVIKDEFAHSFADDLRDCLVRYAETGHFSVPNRL